MSYSISLFIKLIRAPINDGVRRHMAPCVTLALRAEKARSAAAY